MTRSQIAAGQAPTATQSLAYRSSYLGSRGARGELQKIEEEDILGCRADASLLEGPSLAEALQAAEAEEPMCINCLGELQSEPAVVGELERCTICGNDFLNLCYYCPRCGLGLCVSCSFKKHTMQTQLFLQATFRGKFHDPSLHNLALIFAEEDDQERLVQVRLEKGADINSRDEHGRTPLHEAAAHGRDTLVQVLLEKGADINARDYIRQTPLHKAAANGQDRSLLHIRH